MNNIYVENRKDFPGTWYKVVLFKDVNGVTYAYDHYGHQHDLQDVNITLIDLTHQSLVTNIIFNGDGLSFDAERAEKK